MHHLQLESSPEIDTAKIGIRAELDRVLSSESFSRSLVLSRFLKFIVLETLENQPEVLKEYTIAVRALGKPDGFNPQIDAIVRIHAGRLRRLLKEYYSGPGLSNPVRIEVIKGSYVPVFRMKTADSSSGKVENETPSQYFRSKLTLAVLPFRNLCPAKEFQFFADGFGEELTRIFSNFQDISVIAHHSTLKYSAAPDDVRHIGADLGAHYLIGGSIRRSTEDIRVNIFLVETISGVQVWSQTYNCPLNVDGLTSIQDRIVGNVSSVLAGYYGLIIHENSKALEKRVPTLDSFDAALWNYYFHMNFSQETYTQTVHAVKVALECDPDYPRGLAMLAELYLDAYSLGYPTVDNPVKVAYELARKAINKDPQSQHACQIYAWANIYLKRKKESIQAMEHCLSLNPSSVSTMGAIGFGMACAGEYSRANELLTQSFGLNPHSPWWFYLGFFLVKYHDGHYEKALEYANKIEASDVFLGPLSRAIAKTQLGMVKDAAFDIDTVNQKFPEIAANLSMYLNTFILDTTLVNEIVHEFKKAKASLV